MVTVGTRRTAPWAVATFLGLLAACSPAPLSLVPRETGYGHEDYDDVLDDWTRTGEDHHNVWEGRLFVAATYYSAPFRQARLARAEHVYAWDGVERARAEAKDREDARQWHTFFLAAATRDWQWNRLDRSDSPWYIWLEDDLGRKVRAGRVDRVRRGRPEAESFYPYFGNFHEGYFVRFPRALPEGTEAKDAGAEPTAGLPRIAAGSRGFSLRVTGAPGDVVLHWTVAGDEPALKPAPAPEETPAAVDTPSAAPAVEDTGE